MIRLMSFAKPWRAVATTIVALIVVVVLAPPLAAQPEVTTLSAADLAEPVRLLGWRYQSGDDPAWAQPEHDDSTWEILETADLVEVPASGWSGIGWFRLRLRRESDIGSMTLGLIMPQVGASEIYLDGELLGGYGTVASTPDAEVVFWSGSRARVLPIHDEAVHLLAVRYSNLSDLRGHDQPELGFNAYVVDFDRRLERLYAYLAGRAGRWKLWVGAALAFTAFHLCLFAFRPAERSNLYFALAAGGFAGMMGFGGLDTYVSDPLTAQLLVRAQLTSGIIMVLALVIVSRVFANLPRGVGARILELAGVAAIVWVWIAGDGMAFNLFGLMAIAWIVPVFKGPGPTCVEDWIVISGFVLAVTSGLLQILDAMRIIHVGLLYPYGMLYLLLTLSVHLAKSSAVTHRDLEEKLAEVQELSARAIEQERLSREQEVERRLLEADNARKTEELEEARRLQLSLLPRELPRAAGLEVELAMRTATEVGGDYYDYVDDGDGHLTLAIGDATGHGLKAGMVVTATKSLFQTIDPSGDSARDVVSKLDRIARGITGLELDRMNMALALLQRRADGWRLTSAGMPPFLIYRAASGEVEEIELAAPPLGVLQRHRYTAVDVALEVGDLLVAMTDGLPEALNDDHEMLGYEAVRDQLRALGPLPLAEVVAGLFAPGRRSGQTADPRRTT